MKRKFPLLCSFEQCFPGVIVAALFLISLGSMSRYQEGAGLHNRSLFSSKFWRLEVEEGDASKVGFWGSLPLRVVDNSSPAVSPHGLCMRTDRYSQGRVSSSFRKDTSFLPLGPHPYDLIEFNYLLKGPILTTVKEWVRASAYGFGRNSVLSLSAILCLPWHLIS